MKPGEQRPVRDPTRTKRSGNLTGPASFLLFGGAFVETGCGALR